MKTSTILWIGAGLFVLSQINKPKRAINTAVRSQEIPLPDVPVSEVVDQTDLT